MQDLKWFSKFTKQTLSSEEMKVVELNAENLGITELQMMESAGKAVADFVEQHFKDRKNLLVLCGSGNNGGDGFVTARYLSKNHNVVVGIAGGREKIKGASSLINLKALEACGVELVENVEYELRTRLDHADLVVDALVGTGFHGSLRSPLKEIARMLNNSKKEVVAIDLPSGLDATTGYEKEAVKATYTVTFHKMKEGLLKSKKAGKIVCSDIGIPLKAEVFTGPGDLWRAVPKKELFDNKLSHGRVLILGGSEEFYGAPSMAAIAAYNALATLRSGAGYVVLMVPNSILKVAREVSPNLIVRAAGEDYITNLKAIKQEIDKSSVIGIGMGIGRSIEVLEATKEIIKYALDKNKRLVIDADALYALGRSPLNKNAVLTPQEKEFETLYGRKPEAEIDKRVRQAIKLANTLNAVVALKGHITVITDGKQVKLNETETAALATMGTGDVLTGIIAGFATNNAQSMFNITAGAIYLHGRIGDVLAKEKGTHILASDLIDQIPLIAAQYSAVV
ncbi:MAG: NAD(P)H-hydrate dehydratase [Candidatus Micrarchaeia archaeon]